MPGEHRVHLRGRWSATQGFVHGARQPALLGQLHVEGLPADAPAVLDEALAPTLGPLQTLPARGAAADGVIDRLLGWTTSLQRAAGQVVDDARIVGGPIELGSAVRYELLVPAHLIEAAKPALRFVLEVFEQALQARRAPPDLTARRDALLRRLEHKADRGQNRRWLLQAARQLEVPVTHLGNGSYRFGHGNAQRVMSSTLSQHTPAIGVGWARDKRQTAVLLRRHGLPAACHRLVAGADAAVELAREWGYPLVVKPADLDQGVGVACDLRDERAVRQAFEAARTHSPSVLVERHVAGVGHRLTVAHGQVLKVTAKLPWGVTGDGAASVAALVQQDLAERATVVQEPNVRHVVPTLDDEALGMLEQQALSPLSVPAAGHFVPLRRRNNAIAGGTTRRLDLSAVHPDNIELALRAAEAVMLDIAGVDLIVADIGCSWMEQPALVCEVNAQPQSDAATLRHILASTLEGCGRIPTWLLLLVQTPERWDAAQVQAIGEATSTRALSCGTQAWQGGRLLTTIASDARAAAEVLLASPRTDAMAAVMTLDDVARLGLPVDRVSRLVLARDLPQLLRALDAGEALIDGAAWRPWLERVTAGWSLAEQALATRAARLVAPHVGDAQGTRTVSDR